MKFSEDFIDNRDLRDWKINKQSNVSEKESLTLVDKDINDEKNKWFISNLASMVAFFVVLPGYFEFFNNLESCLEKSWVLALFLFFLMALLHFICNKSLKFILHSFMEIKKLGGLRNWQEYYRNKEQDKKIIESRNFVSKKELGGYYSVLDSGRFNITEKQILKDKRKQLG